MQKETTKCTCNGFPFFAIFWRFNKQNGLVNNNLIKITILQYKYLYNNNI